ncbi:lysine N(6)-hydroxylase/L-ornithine N(5)-oxygenase family protein [Metabacillus arenae]|uniref:L-lysine N6-monooxygenase MbtG n=1 Tax=Metabacillus arenae TaxID=2771434 RepID=A0A926NHB2_9BACI|nr:lysine N(6)-hydroxylase/L-ornithine N(5)-oxygenase family protein [Metabacillus arenae]MBD1380563.1 lysine N(6)-hydroxylase/L-ornithine N(5)-oxygenase family protein [Metabacillus arenae]
MEQPTYSRDEIYDVIGIGLGPFNLGLAALLEPVAEIKGLFFERNQQFNWHPGVMIDGTTLQVPFMADLVTMADATSKYSYLSYLQEHQRLYHYYFLENFHIHRKEYNHYCQWAAGKLNSCRFGMNVRHVSLTEQAGRPLYELEVWNEKSGQLEIYFTKHLVIGIGTTPVIPEHLAEHVDESFFHSSQYMNHKQRILSSNSITVVGSGQSAAEVFQDLLKEQELRGYSLNWLTRSKGFFPMEYSKLGLEYFSPDYIEFFYSLSQQKKDELLPKQDLLYKGISAATIAEIYDELYRRTIANESIDIRLQAMTEVCEARKDSGIWNLTCKNWVSGEMNAQSSEVVIFGTGYKQTEPFFLNGITHFIQRDDKERLVIDRHYALKQTSYTENQIFIQNGELHSHGVGAPDLGLGAYRNSVIINQLAGREVYPVQQKNVFQTFSQTQTKESNALYHAMTSS